MKSSSAVPASQQTQCRPDELRSICRHINHVMQAHRRYSTHNEKLLKTLEDLHQQFTRLTQEYGQLVFDFPGKQLHINGTSVVPLIKPEQHNEFIQLFSRIPVSSMLFTPRSNLRDLSRLFTYLFEEHCPTYMLPPYTKMVSQVPSIQLSPSTLIAANTTQQLRNWVEDLEIIEERYNSIENLAVEQHVVEQMVELNETIQAPSTPIPESVSSKNPRSPHTPKPSSQEWMDAQVEDLPEPGNPTARPEGQAQKLVVTKKSTAPNEALEVLQREPTLRMHTEFAAQPPANYQGNQPVQETQPVQVVPPVQETQPVQVVPPVQETQPVQVVPPVQDELILDPMIPPQAAKETINHGETIRIEPEIPPPSKPAASAESIDGQSPVLLQSEEMTQLFAQARKHQHGPALNKLLEHCEQCLPFGLVALQNLSARQDKEAHTAVYLQMIEMSSPIAREKGLRQSLSCLNELPDVETQEFCFSLCRQYVPDLLESYIFQSLSVIRFDDLRIRLFKQAVACNTPRLRRMLLQQLQNNVLAHDPVQEEWLLRYLHRTQTFDALAFLQQRITDLHTELSLRNSAIWMLGAFQNATSLTMLEQILISSCPDHIEPEHWQTLQHQAIQTLSRFPESEAKPLLSVVKQNAPKFHQAHIHNVLREPPPEELHPTQQATEEQHRRFRSKVWLTVIVGTLLSIGTLATLYFSGWLTSLLK